MSHSESPHPPDMDQADRLDDAEWPTHCEHCGTRLASAQVDETPDLDSEHRQTASPGTVVARDFCPNPDCPARSVS